MLLEKKDKPVKQKMILVAGARPNFMKIAPLMKALAKSERWQPVLVHTGQHYDFKMSDVFFKELKIPKPDIFLNIGAGSHASQTAAIMQAFEKVILKDRPGLVVVVGDVNSTIACSLVASKLGIRVAHVEAGLRSFDRTMPEEINRLVTDSISDLLFVSEESGVSNLRREGVDPKKVHFVGNVMIDTLMSNLSSIRRSGILKNLKLKPKEYCVVTLHRPSNVDSLDALIETLHIFKGISEKYKIVYPVHPRTKKMMVNHNVDGMFGAVRNLMMIDPLGYSDFVSLVQQSKFVLTDSGGIQEETTVLKVPCITMRKNTERPSTLKDGGNVLVGRDKLKIFALVDKIRKGKWKDSKNPKLWDGRAAGRIAQVLEGLRT